MKVEGTDLPGVVVLEPDVHRDDRGLLFESFRADRCADARITVTFVQDTQTRSAARTLRGLHYQLTRPQSKLVRVLRGRIWDVALDVRRDSPTFAQWAAVELSAENFRQVFIPAGFAHGYCVPDGEADVLYRMSDYFVAADQYGVAWNDPALAIPWPVKNPVMSDRDRALRTLDPSRDDLPVYDGHRGLGV